MTRARSLELATSTWIAAVGVVVILLSGLVGLAAERASGRLRDAAAEWRSAMVQVADAERALVRTRLPDSASIASEIASVSALGVQPDGQSRVVAAVDRLAAGAGSLDSVRVAAVPTPSGTFVPLRHLRGMTVQPATYAVAVEFTSRFVDARKFVNSLPPSVSVSRLDAARTAEGTRYKLLLSVYELHANPRP